MSQVQVTDHDRGWSQMERTLQELAGLEVVVGIQSDAPDPDAGGMNMATLAAIHEFGAGHIPERSFLRSTFDAEASTFTEDARRTIKLILDGAFSPTVGLRGFGERVEAKIKRTITAGISPPLKARSGTPLIDTATLIRSIRYVVRPKGSS